jgi:hypothetical protein
MTRNSKNTNKAAPIKVGTIIKRRRSEYRSISDPSFTRP